MIISTVCHLYCVKCVLIRSFSGLYFPAFGLNTERYVVLIKCYHLIMIYSSYTDIACPIAI